MRKVHKDRLLKLANFLRGLNGSRKFRLSVISIVTLDKNNQPVLPSKEYASPKEGFCGTTACAIGWCPVVFPYACKYEVESSYDCDYEARASVVSKRYSNIADFEWAEEYFGLEYDSSDYLFNPVAYPKIRSKVGAISVANRIEKFVANNGKFPNSYSYL